VVSALVLLGAVGFTLVAAYQWVGRLGIFGEATTLALVVRGPMPAHRPTLLRDQNSTPARQIASARMRRSNSVASRERT
jgi:hypothetical protein